MYQSMSLRATVYVIATEYFFYDTSVVTSSLAFIQLYSGIAKHHCRYVISTACSLTTAVCIVSNCTASQVDHSALLDTTHLTTTIDIIANGAA